MGAKDYRLVERGAPGRPRVVDEDVNLRLALLDGIGEGITASLVLLSMRKCERRRTKRALVEGVLTLISATM